MSPLVLTTADKESFWLIAAAAIFAKTEKFPSLIELYRKLALPFFVYKAGWGSFQKNKICTRFAFRWEKQMFIIRDPIWDVPDVRLT